MVSWACPEFDFSSKWHSENNLGWASPSSSGISRLQPHWPSSLAEAVGLARKPHAWSKEWGRSEIEVRALCGHQGGLLVSGRVCKRARTTFWEWTIPWRPTGSGQPALRRENCRTLHCGAFKLLEANGSVWQFHPRKLLGQRQRILSLSIAIRMRISICSSVSPGPRVLREQYGWALTKPCTHRGLHPQRETLNSGNPDFLLWALSMPSLCCGETLFMRLKRKNACSLL